MLYHRTREGSAFANSGSRARGASTPFHPIPAGWSGSSRRAGRGSPLLAILLLPALSPPPLPASAAGRPSPCFPGSAAENCSPRGSLRAGHSARDLPLASRAGTGRALGEYSGGVLTPPGRPKPFSPPSLHLCYQLCAWKVREISVFW